MPLVTRFKIGGINSKSSYLDFPQDDITDSLNIEKDKNGFIKKRDGFSEFAPATGGNIIGMIHDPFRNEIIAVTPTEVCKVTTATKANQGKYYSKLFFDLSYTFLTSSTKAKLYPFAKNIYILDQDKYNDLYKFDGTQVYNAKIHEDRRGIGNIYSVTKTGGAAGSDWYMIFIKETIIDKNGNFNSGNISRPWKYTLLNVGSLVTDGVDVVIESMTNNFVQPTVYFEEDGFESRKGVITTTDPYQYPIAINSGHNIQVGDYILKRIPSTTRDQYILEGRPLPPDYWKVITVTPTSITIDNPTQEDLFWVAGEVLYVNHFVEIYAQRWSSTVTGGATGSLKTFGMYQVNTEVLYQTINIPLNSTKDGTGDFSLDQVVLYNAPKPKVMWKFQDLIFVGNTRDVPRGIFWSQVDSYEAFNIAEDNLVFNDEYSTEVTAIRDLDDYLIVWLNNSIWFVTGTFGSQQISRQWRTNTDGIGCSTDESIQGTPIGLVFLHGSGFYSIKGGGEPSEVFSIKINEEIRALVGYTFTDAKSIYSEKNKKYYCFIPHATTPASSLVYMYDFFNETWSKWSGIDAKNGFIMKDNLIYFCKSNYSVQKFTACQLNDNGVAINAYVKTAWEHISSPSIEKKFLSMRVYCLSSADYTMTIKTEKDFVENTFYTNSTFAIKYTKDNNLPRHKLNNIKCTAMRFTFANNVINENLLISGYEMEIEATQQGADKDQTR
jgi:hypothetical protein